MYEAGFCGFWIHDRLTELGIHNIVVNPADVPTMGSERLRKTDAVDSRKLRALSHTERFEGTLKLLMTVPGIGQTTGLALMAEIVYITLRKNAVLRSGIIEAAWVAVRKDEAMQLCYLNNRKRMFPARPSSRSSANSSTASSSCSNDVSFMSMLWLRDNISLPIDKLSGREYCTACAALKSA